MAKAEHTITIEASDELKQLSKRFDKNRTSAFDLVSRQPWAIEPGMLETIVSVARRENETPESVAAKIGRPLQNTRTVSVRDGVAVVPVTGPIFRYANLFTEISGATSLEVLATDFNAALNDSSIKAIVLEIDSPGGQATGISDFADMVRAADKPVVAFVGGMGASAAYWIAAGADELVMSKTAEVGSIGAVFGVYRSSADAEVIEFVSTQSPMKRPDPESDAGRTELQGRIDALAQVFVEDVAQFRGVSVETVLSDFGRGGVRLGEEAVRLGMADRVSTLENVIAGLATGTNPVAGGSRMATQDNGKPVADQQPEITRAYLEANHADLVGQLRAEGIEEGRKAGAEAERARIQSVEEQLIAGHEGLIATLKFDGVTTGEMAAVKVLAAEKSARTGALDQLRSDAPAAVADPALPDESGATASDEPAGDIEAQAKAKWGSSEAVRAEFGQFSTFLAYAKNQGSVRVIGSKSK